MIQEPKGKFIKVRCKCKNEQVIFGKCSSKIDCLVCGELLALATGGKSKIEAQVIEILE